MKCWELRTTCAGSLLLLASLIVPALAAAGPSAHLREEAVVKGAVIRLGDVARIEGSASAVAQLSRVELGPSPLPGRSRSVEKDYIIIRLRQHKVDPAVLAADSATQCRVTRSSQTLSADTLIETARKFLEEKIEPGDGKLVIEPVSRPREMVLPEGELGLACELIGNPGTGANRRVMVQVMVGGEPAGRADISLRARRYVKVAIATTTIPRGAALTGKISFEERDRMSLPQDVILEGDSLDGLQAVCAIAAGSVISRRQAAEPAVVHRGDAVTVQAKVGGIVISATAVADEDGRPGQAIRVRNTDSNKQFRAQVVNAKTVEALFQPEE